MALKIRISDDGLSLNARWRDAGPGALKVKVGSDWVVAGKAYVKIGGIGGGYWYDSGYVGYPDPPQSFSVPSWNFSTVNTSWVAPSGGAPVDHFEVIKTDAATTPTTGTAGTTVSGGASATTYAFSVSENEKCQLWLRSVSAAGLKSGWVGPLRVQIGHPEVGAYHYVEHTEGWNSALTNVNLYLNAYRHDVFVPSDVHMETLYINLRNNEAGWAKLSPDPAGAAPPAGRRLFWILNGTPQWADWHSRLDVPNPWYGQNGNGWQATDYWGNNATWGFAIDGTGYSVGPTKAGGAPSDYRIYGEFQIFGTRHWTTYDYYVTTSRVENSYWSN